MTLWRTNLFNYIRDIPWFARNRGKAWATCPLTEPGFVRIVSNPAFSRDAVTLREAAGVLAANTTAKEHLFWPDELPLGRGDLPGHGSLVISG
jgi:uncharacterized protein